jgi:hypothetical protein
MASNSTQVITDLNTAAGSTFTAGEIASANAAAGPITDLPGSLAVCKLKIQEVVEILAYILEGKAIQTSLTAPSGGIIPSSDTTLYNTLVGVYQILK